MKRILYFDASAGVSGDMFVGALLDLGASLDLLRAHVACLGLDGLELRAHKVTRRGVDATKFDVLDPHTGRGVEETNGGGPEHHHRSFREIRALIEGSPLPGPIAAHAVAVFERLAAAEATAHGVSPGDVCFHEVGALDSIADIVAGASAFHQLNPDEAWCSPIHVGSGTVRCAHGVLPVPAPATRELLRGAEFYATNVSGELATPTGVALLRHFCRDFCLLPSLVVEAVGNGAGTKDFGLPNVLRVVLGSTAAKETPIQNAPFG